MNSQFAVAHLSPEVLSEIKLFEEKLRSQVNENIVLIAYSDRSNSSQTGDNA